MLGQSEPVPDGMRRRLGRMCVLTEIANYMCFEFCQVWITGGDANQPGIQAIAFNAHAPVNARGTKAADYRIPAIAVELLQKVDPARDGLSKYPVLRHRSKGRRHATDSITRHN